MGCFINGELAWNLQLKGVHQIIAEVLANLQDLKFQLLTGKLLILFYGSMWQKWTWCQAKETDGSVLFVRKPH